MRLLRKAALLTLLMTLGTWLLGWWAVPLIAAGVALWDRNSRGGIVLAAAAAAVGWGLLLMVQNISGSSVAQFNRALAISLNVPAITPLLMTLLLPALLAASAAGTVVALKRWRAPDRAKAPD